MSGFVQNTKIGTGLEQIWGFLVLPRVAKGYHTNDSVVALLLR